MGDKMRKPYFLCLAVLSLWGAVSGNLIVGITAGIILELSHLVKKKADLTIETYTRISDLTSIIFIASIFIFYFNNEPFQILPLLAKWLPGARI